MKQTTKSEPIASLRIGRLEAAIWENPREQGVFHSVTVTRSYRDGENYKSTHSYDPADLANVAKLVNWAADYLIKNQLEAAT